MSSELLLGNSSYHEGWANNSLTKAHTVVSGNNRILVVGIGRQTTGGASPAVATVTYGGVSMTLVTNSRATTSDGLEVAWWYLLSPAAGAADVVATLGASSNANLIMWIRDYADHDGQAPVGNFKGTNNSASATSVSTGTITARLDELVLSMASVGNAGLTTTWTNATELGDDDYVSMSASLAHRTETGPASYTQTATFSGGGYQAAISVIRLTPQAARASELYATRKTGRLPHLAM